MQGGNGKNVTEPMKLEEIDVVKGDGGKTMTETTNLKKSILSKVTGKIKVNSDF